MQCCCVTKLGYRCRRIVVSGEFCWQHKQCVIIHEECKKIYVEIYKVGREVKILLRKNGKLLYNGLKECFNDISKNYLSAAGDIVLLRLEDDIVGLITVIEEIDSYYIGRVCIFLEYRHRGYCTKMLRLILRDKIYRNKKIYLRVERNNISAIKCYKKVGFVLDEQLENGYDVYVYNR